MLAHQTPCPPAGSWRILRCLACSVGLVVGFPFNALTVGLSLGDLKMNIPTMGVSQNGPTPFGLAFKETPKANHLRGPTPIWREKHPYGLNGSRLAGLQRIGHRRMMAEFDSKFPV